MSCPKWAETKTNGQVREKLQVTIHEASGTAVENPKNYLIWKSTKKTTLFVEENQVWSPQKRRVFSGSFWIALEKQLTGIFWIKSYYRVKTPQTKQTTHRREHHVRDSTPKTPHLRDKYFERIVHASAQDGQELPKSKSDPWSF